MSGLKIDHLGIIVADLEKAIERFRLLTDGEPAYTKEMPEVGLKMREMKRVLPNKSWVKKPGSIIFHSALTISAKPSPNSPTLVSK